MSLRVTLVISSLWGGGAERVLSVLANGWAEQGHHISILTFDHGGGPKYPVHSSVSLFPLGLERRSRFLAQAVLANIRRIWVLRHAIKRLQPDIIVSFMVQANVLTLLATRGLNIPVIVSERTSPRRRSIGPIWRGLRTLSYPFADLLVCPTRSGLAGFQAMIKVQGIAIPNPVVVPTGVKCCQCAHPNSHILVAMGRLIPEKGFDLLLEAFALIGDRHPEWRLNIIGEGPLLSELEEQSKTLKLEGRIRFVGKLIDPFPALRAADLFVLSSRFEGFPMALAESMACGLPVISFDCPEGPRDIIRDGIDGVLVPPGDVAALAAVLDRLMSNSQERVRLAARAPEVTTRFSREHILSQWQQLFDELLSAKGISPVRTVV